tara:strand:+ start:35 stop:751 length:717 start_codon:yes stop_codon:yes gene_type:complete
MAIDKIGTNGLVASAIVPPDGTITTAKLADDAVTSAKIGTDVIVAEDLANNSITVAELSNGAVTAAKLASGAITTAALPTGSVLQVQHGGSNSATGTPTAVSHNGTNTSALYGTGRNYRTYGLAGTVNITPTATSSKLLCFGTIKWSSPTTTASSGAIVGVITLNDTSSIDAGDYPFYPYGTNQGSMYAPPMTWSGVFTPNSTSQQVIRIRPGAYSESNQTFTPRYTDFSLIVMEIAG